MDLLPSLWLQFLIVVIVPTVGGGLVGGAQNWVQGDDVRRSIKGGLAGGGVAGVVAYVMYHAFKSLPGGGQ